MGPKGADFAWEAFTDVRFDVAKADIRPSENSKLSALAAYMMEHPGYLVELEAYADPRGSQAFNLDLTRRRVEAVRGALIQNGIPRANIVTGAYGKMNLKCAQEDEACWQQNRRVEIKVVPMPSTKVSEAAPMRLGSRQ